MTKQELIDKIKKEIFTNIHVDVFINNKRIAIEYDKKEIYYFNPTTGTLRTSYFNLDKLDTIKELYFNYLEEVFKNGKE